MLSIKMMPALVVLSPWHATAAASLSLVSPSGVAGSAARPGVAGAQAQCQ